MGLFLWRTLGSEYVEKNRAPILLTEIYTDMIILENNQSVELRWVLLWVFSSFTSAHDWINEIECLHNETALMIDTQNWVSTQWNSTHDWIN